MPAFPSGLRLLYSVGLVLAGLYLLSHLPWVQPGLRALVVVESTLIVVIGLGFWFRQRWAPAALSVTGLIMAGWGIYRALQVGPTPGTTGLVVGGFLAATAYWLARDLDEEPSAFPRD